MNKLTKLQNMNNYEKLYIIIYSSFAIESCKSRVIPEYHGCPESCPYYYNKIKTLNKLSLCSGLYDYYDALPRTKRYRMLHVLNNIKLLSEWINLLILNINQLKEEFCQGD